MSQKDTVSPLLLTDVNTAATAIDTWTAFSDGIEGACFMIRITNDSDTDVYISYDGSTRHEYVPSDESIEISFQDNSSPGNGIAKLKKGTILSVQGTAGTGLVYLSGYFNN